jgi:hypothetical protein
MKRLLAAFAAAAAGVASLVAVAQAQQAPAGAAAAPPKLTICHKTGSSFQRITVSSRAFGTKSSSGRALRAHMLHTGDAIVVGTGACPAASATPSPTSTPPTKMTICHKTGSTTNPYRRITVSSRAVTNPKSQSGRILRGHMGHTGDLLMPGATACPSGTTGKPAQGVKLTATLQPVAPATAGSGTATVTIRLGKGQLCFTLSVSGLTNVTAAHIHRASTGDVVVPLTAPTSGTSSGCVNVEKSLLQEILANPSAFYVNVHTTAFPGGQIRGNLTR